MAQRKTCKYRLIVDGETVLFDITADLARRELEHRVRWPGGRIEKVGRATTFEAGWHWQRREERARVGSAVS